MDAEVRLKLDDQDADKLHEPLPDMQAGTQLFEIKPDGTHDAPAKLTLYPAAFSKRLRHDDPAQRLPELAGTLTAGGKPVPKAQVVLYKGEATRVETARLETDSRGRFRFENVRGGSLGFQTKHDTLVPADGKSWRDLDVPHALGTVKTFDLELTEGGFVTGRLTDAAGQPRAKAALRMSMHVAAKPGEPRGAKDFTAYAETDADGKYRSPPLFPGKYIVEENADDYPLIGEAEVQPAKTTPLPK